VAAVKNINIAVEKMYKGDRIMYRIITRILFLTLVLIFLLASTIFIFKYSEHQLLMVGYALLASFTGFGAFSSLFWDDIPDLIDEIKYRRGCYEN
jgi:Na+/melibiose symporter-like transporter